MGHTIIEHELRVFISSRCGGSYTVARKALKKLLEATGLVTVYCFETEPATSEDTISAYLNYVDESNLCIFLVDNQDGASAAVLSEQKRAKEKNLRCLYIFNDESEKNTTPMQKEVKESFSEKYKVVHEFSDFAPMAFDSVMQDLVSVYKHKSMVECDAEKESTTIDSKPFNSGDEDYHTIKLANFPTVQSVLTERLLISRPEMKDEGNQVDALLSEALKIVLFESGYAEETFDKLKAELTNFHNGEMLELVSARLTAQKQYHENKYEECLATLQEIIKQAISMAKIPTWFVNDIAIDLRHLVERIHFSKGILQRENEGQSYLDKSVEPVYYPYVDRQISNMFSEVANNYYKQLTVSPYTTRYGGLEPMFESLSREFCYAELHGSIVQTELVRDRLIAIYSMLCALYDDYDLFWENVCLLVINKEAKKLDTLVRTHNHSLDRIGSEDVLRILSRIENITDTEWRLTSKYILASRLADCLNDNLFQVLYHELKDEAFIWINDEKRTGNLETYVFSFFRANTFRAGNEDALDFLDIIIKKELARYYSECFTILQVITCSDLSDEEQKRVKSIIIELLHKEAVTMEPSFSSAIVRFCKKAIIPIGNLETVLEQKNENYYLNTYKLEMLSVNNDDPTEYINRLLVEASDRNKSQGVNGAYTGYVYDCLDVIVNILMSREDFSVEPVIEEVVRVAIETLSAERQTVKAKMYAIRLLRVVFARSMSNEIWNEVSDTLLREKPTFSRGVEPGFFSKDSNGVLAFYYNLLIGLLNKEYGNLVLESLLSYSTSEPYDVIQILSEIASYLVVVAAHETRSELLFSFLYFSVAMLQHKERDVRFHATGCLIELTNYEVTSRISLEQLSRIMDVGSRDEKIVILNWASRIRASEEDYLVHIVNKGKGDNSFLVRYHANEIALSSEKK